MGLIFGSWRLIFGPHFGAVSGDFGVVFGVPPALQALPQGPHPLASALGFSFGVLRFTFGVPGLSFQAVLGFSFGVFGFSFGAQF